MDNPELPVAFVDRIRANYGDEAEAVLTSLDEDPPISIRYHSRKGRDKPIEDAIPWCLNATYLKSRPTFALDPLYHAGAYYPQEASSMSIEVVLKLILNNDQPLRVLDLCAAPGGKSTHLLDLLPEKSILVSNEIVSKRYSILEENLFRWGSNDYITTNLHPAGMERIGPQFDIVLVDAPCSGEGLFRKQASWRSVWSESNCSLCATRQSKILRSADRLLKPNGYLIYSTCTFNSAENLEQIKPHVESGHYQSVPVTQLEAHGFTSMDDEVFGYQASPHRVRGEGFFISCLKKADSKKRTKERRASFKATRLKDSLSPWPVPNESLYLISDRVYACHPHKSDMVALLQSKRLPFRMPELGVYKRGDFIPSHFLAMQPQSTAFEQAIDVDYEEAIRFLRHDPLHVNVEMKGWHLIQFKETALGWIKSDGKRINNKYPMKWRLRLSM